VFVVLQATKQSLTVCDEHDVDEAVEEVVDEAVESDDCTA
jgi:hypothetical protein